MSDSRIPEITKTKIKSECKKEIILFIQKTITYAENHIQQISCLENYSEAEREKRRQRLQAWLNYLEFQQHTLKELQTGKLDDWFQDFREP